MKIVKNKKAKQLVLIEYTVLYLIIILGLGIRAVYLKYGYLIVLLLQYNIFLLYLLPIFVGLSLKFFPEDLQKIICKKGSFIKLTDQFFSIVKKINVLLIILYLVYNLTANYLDYDYMKLMKIHEAIIMSIVAMAGVYVQHLFYHNSAIGREYNWCKKWRK
ncbi:hypothetical protein [Sulfurimonas sp.]|uniref:hypothetical protein n=1 Tax=Sulfurimonas sp. TaxID=2022749 RepID=UPI003D130636